MISDAGVDENSRLGTDGAESCWKILQSRARDDLGLLHGHTRCHVESGHILGDIPVPDDGEEPRLGHGETVQNCASHNRVNVVAPRRIISTNQNNLE